MVASLRNSAAWAILAILAFSSGLFVLKYAPRVGIPPAAALAGYLVVFSVHCLGAWGLAAFLKKSRHSRYLLFLCLGVFVAAALAVYWSIDPMALAVDRWSAIDHFLTALFKGDYPYRAESHLGHIISGFPGLFLLALPFYLLGDVGMMQFAAFVGFAFLAVRLSRESAAAFVLLLLAGLPIFAYEVVVRSDLFFNMTAVAWLVYLGRNVERAQGGRLLILAAAWGLLLSTRGVVIVPLLLAVFPLLMGRSLKAALAFAAVLVATFAATLIPFYLWDPAFFLDRNPYIVQSGYIPGWALVLVLLVSGYLGFRHRTTPRIYFHSGFILFGIVLGCLLLKVLQTGYTHSLWESGFDISYFSLPLPFLLLHLASCVGVEDVEISTIHPSTRLLKPPIYTKVG